MNLFKLFLELLPSEALLLVGTVTAVGATKTTLETRSGGVVVLRGRGIAIGQKAFPRAEAIVGLAPDLPTYEIEV